PIFGIGLKIQITESITLTPPHQGAAAYVIAADPIKRSGFHKGAFFFLNPKVQSLLNSSIVPTKYGIVFPHLLRGPPPVWKLPGSLACINIVLYVFDIAPTFKQQGL